MDYKKKYLKYKLKYLTAKKLYGGGMESDDDDDENDLCEYRSYNHE